MFNLLFVVVTIVGVTLGASVRERSASNACSGDDLKKVWLCVNSEAMKQQKTIISCSEKCFNDNNCPYGTPSNDKDDHNPKSGSKSSDKSDDDSEEDFLPDIVDPDIPQCVNASNPFEKYPNKKKLIEAYKDLVNFTTMRIYACMKRNKVVMFDMSSLKDEDSDDSDEELGKKPDWSKCNTTNVQRCMTTVCDIEQFNMCKMQETCSKSMSNVCDFTKSTNVYKTCARSVIRDGFAHLKQHFYINLGVSEAKYPVTKQTESCLVTQFLDSIDNDPCDDTISFP